MTIAKLIANLQALDLPGDTPVRMYNHDEGTNLGSPFVKQMLEDQAGDLWPSIEDAQASADLADCVADPGEVAVTGKLTPVVALSLFA